LKSITLIDTQAPDRKIQPETGYVSEVISFDKKILYSFLFEVPLVIYVDEIDSETGRFIGKTEILDETDFSLIIPYFPNGEKINIYNPEKEKILEIDISSFSEKCEEDMCESDKKIEDKKQKNNSYVFLVIFLLLIIISGFIIFKRLKSEKQNMQKNKPIRNGNYFIKYKK